MLPLAGLAAMDSALRKIAVSPAIGILQLVHMDCAMRHHWLRA